MKLTGEMIRAIREAIEEQGIDMDWTYIGVRIQEEPFVLGGLDHNSHNWVDGDDTGEELDGACAIAVHELETVMRVQEKAMGEYVGDHVAIIAGDNVTYGEDIGEIIIQDAAVVAVIC